MEFDHEDGLISYVYESFCMEYELEFDIFAFDDQCDYLIHESILASISFSLSPSHRAQPSAVSYTHLTLPTKRIV